MTRIPPELAKAYLYGYNDDDEEMDEDYDPTPQFLYDNDGGEPPLTQEEIERFNEEREAAWLLDWKERAQNGI